VGLGAEVKPEVSTDSGRLTHLKAVKGVLHTTMKVLETRKYTVKNSNPQDRPDFKLVSKDRPAETARDVSRHAVRRKCVNTAQSR
jgi:hypothetical protein